ncbi:MAG: MoxR family ATPase [Chloroflexi bacterium]|nr:MoxR family ATPase [Chloroflexota bacterium]
MSTYNQRDMPELPSIDADQFREIATKVEQEISQVIVGQRMLIRQMLITLLAGGNALLEGVPGLGKTMLVRTLAQVIDATFSRIQFTPDLMPADIVGTTMLVEDDARSEVHSRHRMFRFEPGPVFANLVLADEINRATPKTQSALLEAMQERSVTVYKTTHPLAEPFFVLATQNPLEMEGTYPLPEAQLDRFFFKLDVSFPTLDELVEIANRTTGTRIAAPQIVTDSPTILSMQRTAREVPIASHVTTYAARMLQLTHPETPAAPELVRRFVRYGASPRGLQALILGSKISALLEGRFNVSLDDLRTVVFPALRHRLILNFEGQAEGIAPDHILQAVMEHHIRI